MLSSSPTRACPPRRIASSVIGCWKRPTAATAQRRTLRAGPFAYFPMTFVDDVRRTWVTMVNGSFAQTDTLTPVPGVLEVSIGHAPERIEGADAVVTSTAVRGDNPEVIAARARRIPVVPRAVMLAELMRLKRGVAIAGTHGKTTTTSLVASVLAAGSLDHIVRRRVHEMLQDEAYKGRELSPILKNLDKNHLLRVRPHAGKGTKLGQVLATDADYRRAAGRPMNRQSAAIPARRAVTFHPRTPCGRTAERWKSSVWSHSPSTACRT